MLTSGKLTNISKLQNIISQQTRLIGYRLVQNHQEKRERDMREHDSRILDDEFKQISIQFDLSRAKRI